MHASDRLHTQASSRGSSALLCCFCSGALVLLVSSSVSWAQAVEAPGYVYSFVTLADTTQSCVAIGRGGTFAANGPGFTAKAQSIVSVAESGQMRVVASGFNSVSDCAYDARADVLYVTDNSFELAGALTGDTLFAIPNASVATDLPAVGLEVAVAGSIPSAASVAIAPDGAVYVSDAAGGGSGSVGSVSGGAFVPVVSGLDFAAGLAFESDSSLFVAETLDSFATRIVRYGIDGQVLGVLSGPSYAHGSYDLAFGYDGRLLVTGAFNGPVVAIDTATGEADAVADGFTFATSLDVNRFTGRIELVSSSFTGAAEDSRLHRLTPIAKLSPMGKVSEKAGRECLNEIYGIERATDADGNASNAARCRDGAPCDADGVVNDSCTFPFGVCLNVVDPRLPACLSLATDSFELKKVNPENASLAALAATITEALPVEGTQCFFTDGVTVPVRVIRKGARKPGKQVVKLKAKSHEPLRRTDVDAVKLVCEPAAT